MMTSVATFQDPFSEEAYVSNESAQMGRPIWRLLWIGREMGVSTSMTEAEADRWPDLLADRFHALAKTWYEACGHFSSVREMVLEPAYQEIVGMGFPAVPFILAELERKPEHWFWALRAITAEDPVPAEHRGDIERMARDWLQWGTRKGIHR
jgi:hypothetical protein